MKILVGKVYEGERRITVIPRWRAHMAPIQIRGTDEPAFVAELLAVLEEVRRMEGLPPPPVV